jgi:hypothetical protein
VSNADEKVLSQKKKNFSLQEREGKLQVS